MKRAVIADLCSCVAVCFGVAVAVAASPLPPADAIERAIDAAPEVRAAEARAVEASHAATVSSLGPYDWVLSVEGGRRRIDGEGRFDEWTTGLQRPVRLPGKAALDRQFGARQVEEAVAELQGARREVRVTLLEAWFNCLRTQDRARILDADREFLSAAAESVVKRRRAGDLAELDEALAVAERATAEAEATTARIEAINAARLLAQRVEGVSCDLAEWDAPAIGATSATPDAERLRRVQSDPAVRALAAAADQARIAAERARRDRWPDPTLGVSVGAERSGAERISGLGVSIPIGVRRRSAEGARAAAAAEAAAADLAAAQAEADRQWLQRDAERRRAHEVWRVLADAARQQDRAAALSRRAFELGETSFSESLVVRRAALQSRLAARAAALDAWRIDAIQNAYAVPRAAAAASPP